MLLERTALLTREFSSCCFASLPLEFSEEKGARAAKNPRRDLGPQMSYYCKEGWCSGALSPPCPGSEHRGTNESSWHLLWAQAGVLSASRFVSKKENVATKICTNNPRNCSSARNHQEKCKFHPPGFEGGAQNKMMTFISPCLHASTSTQPALS